MRNLGIAALIGFAATVPLANWMILHVGICSGDGPCVIPILPGITAPSGVIAIGLAFVLRDLVQRTLGKSWGGIAIVIGALLSWWIASPVLAVASVAAYLLGETVDFGVYTAIARRGLLVSVLASAILSALVDSTVFLGLAFHDLTYLPGQVLGKVLAIVCTIPMLRAYARIV